METLFASSPETFGNLTVSAVPGSWAKETPEETQSKKTKSPIMILGLIKPPLPQKVKWLVNLHVS
jgi:hypothetical protein